MQNLDLESEKRLIAIATSVGIERQEVILIFENIAEAAVKILVAFTELIESAFEVLKPLVEAVSEFEIENENRKELYKLDFQRPRIQHQVLNRKPRNLIKKII